MATAPQPTGPLQKVENPTQLNFDALYDAGFSNYQIAKEVGKEYGKDLDGYIDMGGNINDFLYVYTDIAEPGSFSTFMDRMLKGVTKSSPVAAGAIGGAKLGSRVPFAQPVPTLGGAAIGALAGIEVGQQAAEALPFETRPPFRQDRFAAVMGEVIGEGLPLVFSMPFLVGSGTSTAGALVSSRLDNIGGIAGKIARAPGKGYQAAEGFLSGIGQTARGARGKVAQKTLYGVEIGATGMAGVGGAIGQEAVGGGDIGRVAGEVIGGMFEPRLFIMRQVPRLISSFTGKFGSEARETKLGAKLFQTIEKYGENPDDVIAELEANPAKMQQFLDELQLDMDLPPLTPAQITNSPILGMLQNQVAKKSHGSVIDAETGARAEKGYEFIEQIAQALIAQGDAESIRIATQLRTEAIGSLITQSLIRANDNAKATAARLGDNADFDAIGLNLSTQFDQIIKNANEQEAKLWAEVPRKMTVPMEGFFDEVDRIKGKYLLETEDFPKNIADQLELFKSRLGLTDAPSTANPAITAAEKALNNITPAARADYEDVLSIVKNPDQARIFTQGREVETVDMDYALSDPVRVIDAIRARRAKYGSSLSAGDKSRLNTAERVANAELKLLKAREQAGLETEGVPEVGEVNVDALAKVRSRALDAARKAMKDGDRGAAKALGDLANAALRQLDLVSEGTDAAYDTARAFSRGKNDALRRTFLGDTMARDRDGGEVIDPSLMSAALFQGGADATAIRFRELQDGASFVRRELDKLGVDEDLRIPLDDIEFGPVSEQSLNGALTEAVQLAAAKVIDPATGRIDPNKAAKFMDDYEVLLRGYPQVVEMLKDGRQFEDMVKIMTKNKAQYEKALKGSSALAKVLRYESPPIAIAEALGGTRPVDSLESIISTVKKAGSPRFADELSAEGLTPGEAMDGFKSAMIEWMWTKTGGSANKFNFASAKEAMFGPLKKGAAGSGERVQAARRAAGEDAGAEEVATQLRSAGKQRQSVAEILKRNGIFTQAELDRLEYLMDAGAKIQAAQKRGALTDEMVDQMGFSADLLMRLAGARFGTDVASMSGMTSSPLISGSAGIRFIKSQFGTIPEGLQLNMLEKAVMDPAFLVKLLKKGKTAAEKEKNMKFLNAYLINAGLGLADENDTSPGPDIKVDAPKSEELDLAPYIIKQGPTVGPVSMAPKPPRAPTPAPLSAPAPSANVLAQAPSSPQTATRMAAAFPGDGIMGLMATRG